MLKRIFFVGVVILLSQTSYCDVVYLHNGSSIIGEIIESVPGIYFTLRRQDGTTCVFKMEEVWKVKFEEEEMSEDRLYLKDGGVIIGRIIGAIPGETYSIRSTDKSILVFRMDEIEKVEIGKRVYAPSPAEQPQLPVLPQPPVVVSKQPSLLQKKKFLRPWLGIDWPSMKEVNDNLKALEELSKEFYEEALGESFEQNMGIVTDWEIKEIKKTGITGRGIGFGGDLEIELNPNLKLLGRIWYLSYPEFGLLIGIESGSFTYLDKQYNSMKVDMDYKLKPSVIIVGGGIKLSPPVTRNMFVNIEGLLGYGFGRLPVEVECALEMYDLNGNLALKEEDTFEGYAKGGGLFLSLGGELEYKVSPDFSLMVGAGYKRCKIEKMAYEDSWDLGKQGDEANILGRSLNPFDFSGLSLSGGTRFSF
ncbi:MAG: hypothetical protein V2A53_04185 [bacterium]